MSWKRLAQAEGVADSVWLPGARSDVAQVMAGLDVFALPSLAEGISNTLLEAMSCARPVVASGVGGNVELIERRRERHAGASGRSGGARCGAAALLQRS